MGKRQIRRARLTRMQQTVINMIFIAIAVAVIFWAVSGSGYEKSSAKAMEKVLFSELGMVPPFDVVKEYSMNEGESYYDNITVIKSKIKENEVLVTVGTKKTDRGYYSSIQSVSDNKPFLLTSMWAADEPYTDDYRYFLMETNYLEPADRIYGKITDDTEGDGWIVELDCLNDYGNRMNGKHLEDFNPDMTYTISKELKDIRWNRISERCKELGMVPDDNQVKEITYSLTSD